jgi:hypothetical protein
MTDEELRALVRDAIARHLGPGPGLGERAVYRMHNARPVPPWRAHPSFGKFLVMRGDEQGGACLIEPTVACNHCGFCQSYGH